VKFHPRLATSGIYGALVLSETRRKKGVNGFSHEGGTGIGIPPEGKKAKKIKIKQDFAAFFNRAMLTHRAFGRHGTGGVSDFRAAGGMMGRTDWAGEVKTGQSAKVYVFHFTG